MAKGNIKSNKWTGIIDIDHKKNPQVETETLREYLTVIEASLSGFYAFIIHDRDVITQEDIQKGVKGAVGDIKRPHLHFYIEQENETTLAALLNDLAFKLNVDKRVITLDKTNSDYLGVQYLTHKNQDKTKYDFSEIKTNNSELLKKKWEKEYMEPAKTGEDWILEKMIECNTAMDFFQAVGLGTGQRYLRSYEVIKKEKSENFQGWIDRFKSLSADYQGLYDFCERLIFTCMATIPTTDKTTRKMLDLEHKLDILEQAFKR